MELEELPRRNFLKIGLFSGAVIALGGISGAAKAFAGAQRTQYGKLMVLDEEQAAVVYAFAEAALPAAGEGIPSVLQAEVVQRLDEELFFVSSNIVSDLKSALNALEWMPLAYGYFSRFTKLSPEKRLSFFNDMKDTSIETVRVVVSSCRIICFNIYYGHEASWQAIGYDGPFSGISENLGAQRRYYAELIG